MIYGSVCSGIEAATVAWEPLGWKPAWFAEIEKFPSAILAHHFPEIENRGDFTEIKNGIKPGSIDVLVGGTPCQSFSIAGLRGGLDDDRGNLALQFFKLVAQIRPAWVVWENVPGVLSLDRGRAFGSIVGALGELGYGWAYRILDAQYFGVPQRRRRVFLIGYSGGWAGAFAVLFERASMSGDSPPSRETGQNVAGTLEARASTGGYDPGAHGAASGHLQVSHALSASKTASGRLDPSGQTFAIQERAVSENLENGPQGKGYQADIAFTLEARNKVQSVAHTLRGEGFDASEGGTGRGKPLIAFTTKDHGQDSGNIAPTMRAGGKDGGPINIGITDNSSVRHLTPRECEKLQGFPDDFTMIPWRGRDPEDCPDGPRYKALGNSMAVPVMRWVGERIQKVDDIIQANA